MNIDTISDIKAYSVTAGSSSTSANVAKQIYEVSSSSSDGYCNSDTEAPSSVTSSVSSLASSLSALPTTSTCTSHSDTSTSAICTQPKSLVSVLLLLLLLILQYMKDYTYKVR